VPYIRSDHNCADADSSRTGESQLEANQKPSQKSVN
jgi:hypothetical protein